MGEIRIKCNEGPDRITISNLEFIFSGVGIHFLCKYPFDDFLPEVIYFSVICQS